MRSTRAAAAVHRLNARIEGKHYVMVSTGNDLFFLAEQMEDGSEVQESRPMALDDFVAHVDSLGPQKVRRMTKNDIAFEKQLVKKDKPAGESSGE
jgi:hypothetical protein